MSKYFSLFISVSLFNYLESDASFFHMSHTFIPKDGNTSSSSQSTTTRVIDKPIIMVKSREDANKGLLSPGSPTAPTVLGSETSLSAASTQPTYQIQKNPAQSTTSSISSDSQSYYITHTFNISK